MILDSTGCIPYRIDKEMLGVDENVHHIDKGMLGVDENEDKAELSSEGMSSPTFMISTEIKFPKSPTFMNSTEIKFPKSPTFMNSTEIKCPKSPGRSSDGTSSPPGLTFSWARMVAEREVEDEDNDFSPPLWRPGSSSMSSASHPVTTRAQEIARGRQELMKLYEGMPESAYELSLKDLVDQRTAMDKQRAGSERPNSINGGSKKKKAARAGGNKINYPKHVLLNIFVPASLTVRPTPPPSRPLSPNPSRRSSDQNGKNHSNQISKSLHHRNFLLSLFRIRPHKDAELSHCNSFSKVSPGPYSGQSDSPFVGSPIEAKPNNSSRCSTCSGYTVFFKTNCQACEKVYCNNCVKEAIADTPEGRRCRATCMDRSYDERDLEPQMKGCWPSFSNTKGKSARRAKFSFREEDRESH